MKQQILFFTLVIILYNTYGQSYYNSAPFTDKAYKVIPPPPTASELGKYVEIPVGTYTGIPTINVPLYSFSENNYNFDISLSYHASGIKVQQRASWVGLGWSLNAGGLITRTVRDKPDDQDTMCYPSSNGYQRVFPVGWLSPNRYGNEHVLDIESDVYYFNFNGYSGSFIFDENKIPRVSDGSPLRIEYASTPQTRLNSFTITTPDGIRYLFNDKEFTVNVPMTSREIDYPSYAWMYGTTPAPDHPLLFQWATSVSSWYLSRIEFPDSDKQITFNYLPQKYSYLERTKVSREYGPEFWQSACFQGNNWSPRLMYTYSHTLIDGLCLSQIIWSGGSINFTPSNEERDDICLNKHMTDNFKQKEKKLSQIIVKDINDTPRKYYLFNYAYFLADGIDSKPIAMGDYPEDDFELESVYRRLKLVSVTETDGSLTKPPYKFEYNENGPKPNRYSPKCDFWGYYNGSFESLPTTFKNSSRSNATSGNGASELIPTTYIYPDLDVSTIQNSLFQSIYLPIRMSLLPGREVILLGADRNAATTDAAQIYMLQKITYPTGGYDVLTFEPNKFRVNNAAFTNGFLEMTGGGLRVKQIDTYDPVSNKTFTKSYQYVDNLGVCSGKIMNFPLFAVQNGWDPSYDFTSAERISRFSISESELGTTQGSYVGYSNVKIIDGVNGRTEFTFDLPATFGVFQDCFDPTLNDYLYKRNKLKLFELGANSTISLMDIGAPSNRNFYLSYLTFPPNPSIDWNRGQVLEQRIYDANNHLIKKMINTYAIGDYKKVYGKMRGYMRWNDCSTVQLSYPGPITTNDIYNIAQSWQFMSDYQDICGWKYLSKKETITYDQLNLNNGISETEEYEYKDKLNRQLSKVQITLSNQLVKTTQILYPTDYPVFTAYQGQANPMEVMKSKYMINYPIEQKTFVDSKLTSNVLTTYNYISGTNFNLIKPATSYQLLTNSAITDFTALTTGNVNTAYTVDPRMSEEMTYTYYSNGNLKEASSTRTGISTTYIWSYKGQYPIAEIKNATYDQVTSALIGITPDALALSTSPDMVKVDALRVALPGAFVTTCTYKPLVGIASLTDPRGVTSKYEYDTFNRLKLIIDKDNKVLSKFDYNYKQ